MREAIEKRISRRTYTDPLDGKEIDEVNALIADVNRESGLSLELDTDAAAAFASKKYTKGFIHNVTSVVLMKGRSDMPDLREKIGYYGEGLILDLVDMGLDTCWVAGTLDSSRLPTGDGETLVCVIIVGHAGRQKVSEKTVRSMTRGRSKKARDMIESDTEEIPAWIMEGMEAVAKAPSAVNRQKTLFRFSRGRLTAEIADTYIMDMVDLGIAKRHFVEAEGGSFDFGNGAEYHITES